MHRAINVHVFSATDSKRLVECSIMIEIHHCVTWSPSCPTPTYGTKHIDIRVQNYKPEIGAPNRIVRNDRSEQRERNMSETINPSEAPTNPKQSTRRQFPAAPVCGPSQSTGRSSKQSEPSMELLVRSIRIPRPRRRRRIESKIQSLISRLWVTQRQVCEHLQWETCRSSCKFLMTWWVSPETVRAIADDFEGRLTVPMSYPQCNRLTSAEITGKDGTYVRKRARPPPLQSQLYHTAGLGSDDADKRRPIQMRSTFE